LGCSVKKLEIHPMFNKFESDHWLSKQEILGKGIREEDVEAFRIRYYKKQFGVESWYEQLREYTFETQFVELTFEEAVALRDHIVDKRKSERAKIDCPPANIVSVLSKKIDAAMVAATPTGVSGNGFFIKLDTRSPKDCPLYGYDDPGWQQFMATEFKNCPPDGMEIAQLAATNPAAAADMLDNQMAVSFTIAQNKALKVNSGDEALKLLLGSFRIHEDLVGVTSYGPEHFSSGLAIRSWDPWVCEHPEAEFRGFVYEGKLNALTQYFTNCYFPSLPAKKASITSRICSFFEEKVLPRIKATHRSFVIDFLVKADTIMVVELNPFYKGAGAGCFSWKEHRELFMNGPIELRVVEGIPSNCRDMISPPWLRFIESIKETEAVQSKPEKGTTDNSSDSKDRATCKSRTFCCSELDSKSARSRRGGNFDQCCCM